jgi:hypothetical protein
MTAGSSGKQHRLADKVRKAILLQFDQAFTYGSLKNLRRHSIENAATLSVVFELHEELDHFWHAGQQASAPPYPPRDSAANSAARSAPR